MRSIVLVVALLLHSTSIANVLPLPLGNTRVPMPSAIANTTSGANSSSTINESANRATKISCDGKKFGKGLQYLSCLDALTRIPMDDSVKTVGYRGLGRSDIRVPLRFISGKLHALTMYLTVLYLLTILAGDGLCVFDVGTIIPLLTDQITLHYLHNVARDMLGCLVGRDRSEGGQAYNIGSLDMPPSRD